MINFKLLQPFNALIYSITLSTIITNSLAHTYYQLSEIQTLKESSELDYDSPSEWDDILTGK